MKKSSVLAVILLTTTCLIAPVSAHAACPVTVTTAEAGPCILGAGQSTTIESGGSIASTGNDDGIRINAGAAGNITINSGGAITTNSGRGVFVATGASIGDVSNSGTVTSTNIANIYLQSGSVAGSIVNNETGRVVSTNSHVLDADDATIQSGIVNNGSFTAHDSAIRIFKSTVTTGGITNGATGSIVAGGRGIDLDGNPGERTTVTGSVVNNGTIESGIHGIFVEQATVNGNIINSKSIKAAAGHGIVLQDTSTAGDIVNETGASIRASNDGIKVHQASTVAGHIVNRQGASIHGDMKGIFIDNGASVIDITNSGVISSGDIGLAVTNATVSGGVITNNATGRISGSNRAVSITAPVAPLVFNNHGELDGAIRIDDTILNLEDGTVAAGTIGGSGGTVNIKTDLATSSSYGGVDGALAEIHIASDKTFTARTNGIGFTATDFNNNGIFKIEGNTSSSVTANVTGAYEQAATGILSIDAHTPSVHSNLAVTGTANFLAGSSINVNITGNEFDFSNKAAINNVVTATGGVTAPSLNVTDSSYLFNFTADVQANAINLQSVADANSSVEKAATDNKNNPGLGAAKILDNIIAASPGGDMGNVINALGAMKNEKEISDAVSQTLPTLTAGASAAVLQTMGATGQIIQARQSQNTGLSSGDGIIADNNVWVKPFGTWSNQDSDDGITGYDADTYGIVGGVDGAVSDAVRLGVAMSYASTDVESDDSRNKMEIDSYQATTYGSYAIDAKTEASFQIGGGYNNADSKRVMPFGGLNRVANGDIDGYALQVGAGIGRSIDVASGTTLTPSARLDYTLLHTESYTENDAGGLNLKVRSQTTDQLIPSVSARLNHELNQDFSVGVNAGVGYDVLSDRNSVTASYVGGGAAFVTRGIESSPWVVRSGVGLRYNVTDDMDLSVRYDREDRGEFDAQTASVRFRKAF